MRHVHPAAVLTAAITGGLLAPALTLAETDALRDRLLERIRGFAGRVFLYAKHLDTGRDVAIDADERVRTASTIKLPILCAVANEVAAGRARWNDPMVVTEAVKVSGSGVLSEFSDGTSLTLRDVATLMIVVSDNTATNMILHRFSADLVNDYLDTLGLKQTRSLRKVRGDGSALKPPSGWSKAGLLEENQRFGIGVSTPREMVRLLELLAAGKVVNAEVSKDILAVLERQQFKDGIGRRADANGFRVASKSGALDALRSDVGLAYTKRGTIAIAITVDGMPTPDYSPDNAGNLLIWELTSLILDGLAAH